MSTNITHSHDKFFKTLFSKKEAVAEVIEKILPSNISEPLDLDTLILDNTEYVDEELKNTCSDVVYNCQYKQANNETIEVKISLLFEHKSYQEKYPHLQILRYFLNIWEMQVKQNQPITPIIPIIFYHGKSKWKQDSFDSMFAEPIDPNIQQFVPDFKYGLIDTNLYDNQYFKQLSNADIQIGILLMKHIFKREKILAEITNIFENTPQLLISEDGRKSFETMVIYLCNNTPANIEQVREKMRTISREAEQNFVSTYEQLILKGRQEGLQEGLQKGKQEGLQKGKQEGLQKGKQEGLQEGLQEGMQKGLQKGLQATAKKMKQIGMDYNTIASITNLSLEEIEKL